MPHAKTFIPDPPPSDHVQAPPSAAHTNLPADEPVWAAARLSFISGASLPVVAERHGLNIRTVQRRAQAEKWKALKEAARPSLSRALGRPSAAEELESKPDLHAFVTATTYEVGQLLMEPTPNGYVAFAFRKSVEAAAQGAVAEAQGWMRLVSTVQRAARDLDRQRLPFSEADYIRAMYAAGLRGEPMDDGCDDAEEEEETVALSPKLKKDDTPPGG